MGDRPNPLIAHYKKEIWKHVDAGDMVGADFCLRRLGQLQGLI